LIEEKGFQDVYALKGGWKEWFKQENKEEYPVEEK
jgi:predicted sulfurtransferase